MSDSATKGPGDHGREPATSEEMLEAAAEECHLGWRGYAITLVGHARGPGLAHEAFLAVWKAEPGLTSVRHADRYVMKCVRSAAPKMLASRSARAEAERRLERELSHVMRPEGLLWLDVERCWGEAAESGLAVGEVKEAFYLWLAGLSYRRIAEIQGCGTSTAYERVERAKALLRDFFNNPPNDLGGD